MRMTTNVQQVIRIRESRRQKYALTVAEGLEKKAHVVLRKANYYVPKKTLALMNSGHVEVEGKGFGARARVVYGDQIAYYALYVHENMNAAHAPPTCAKFLERAERETRGARANISKGRSEASENILLKGGEVVT